MPTDELKADLHGYLRSAREVLLWKLDGLSEYDRRRPLVPTGTNLLGLVKHLAFVEAGYFGTSLGRPVPPELRWDEGPDADHTADLWATAHETSQGISDLYRSAWALADAAIESLPLESTGLVAWWPEGRRAATLHRLLVHVIAETNRHAGHADIVRELIDGSAGLSAGNANLTDVGPGGWAEHRRRLEEIARQASG